MREVILDTPQVSLTDMEGFEAPFSTMQLLASERNELELEICFPSGRVRT